MRKYPSTDTNIQWDTSQQTRDEHLVYTIEQTNSKAISQVKRASVKATFIDIPGKGRTPPMERRLLVARAQLGGGYDC